MKKIFLKPQRIACLFLFVAVICSAGEWVQDLPILDQHCTIDLHSNTNLYVLSLCLLIHNKEVMTERNPKHPLWVDQSLKGWVPLCPHAYMTLGFHTFGFPCVTTLLRPWEVPFAAGSWDLCQWEQKEPGLFSFLNLLLSSVPPWLSVQKDLQ